MRRTVPRRTKIPPARDVVYWDLRVLTFTLTAVTIIRTPAGIPSRILSVVRAIPALTDTMLFTRAAL
jgi:hypothetical protein